MFLNESNMYMNRKYGNNQNIYLSESNEVPSDPMYCVQMLMEEEEAWHNLEIAMIKAEHTAIVNEDTMLLEAADDDFKTKARKFFQDFGQQFLRYVDQVINKWTEIQLKIMSKSKKLDKLEKWFGKNGGGKFAEKYGKNNSKTSKKNKIESLTCEIDVKAIEMGRNLAKLQGKIITMMNKFESGLTQRRRGLDDSDNSNLNNNIIKVAGDYDKNNAISYDDKGKPIQHYHYVGNQSTQKVTVSKNEYDLSYMDAIDSMWTEILGSKGQFKKNVKNYHSSQGKYTDNDYAKNTGTSGALGRDVDGDFRTYRGDRTMGETKTLNFLEADEKNGMLGRKYIFTDIIPFARDERKKAIDVLKNFRKTGTKILNIAISHTKNNDGDSDDIKVAKKAVTQFKQTCNDYIIMINRATLNALKAINKAVEIVKKPSKATSDTIQKQRKAGGVNYQRKNEGYSVLDDFM